MFVDGNNVAFTAGTAYSGIKIGGSGASTAGLNVTDQTAFSFANFPNSSSFNFSLTGNTAGDVLLNLTPVPEPATVVGLAALGLAAAGAVRRRRLA